MPTLKKKIAIDRLTMTVSEVAKKYNRTVRSVNRLTEDSPLKHRFKDDKKVKRSRAAPENIISRESKSVKTNTPIKEDILLKMNKGEVKLQKGETVFKTKVHDVTQQRQISLHDPKNTIIFVKKSDPRTDDEIRSQYNRPINLSTL